MQLPSVVLLLLSAGIAFGALHPATNLKADYDFGAAITGPVTIKNKKIEVSVKVSNRGAKDFEGTLRFKGFLIPDENHPLDSDLNDGTVLPIADLPVSVAAGQEIVVPFRADLPILRKAKYLIGVIVNSNDAVLESTPMNNATDLVEAGELEVIGHRDVPMDLYAEINGPIRLIMGGAGHSLRTILRGDKLFFPSDDYPSEKLWARFYAANLAKRSLYMLPYDKYEFDKNWYSVYYANETDKNGKAIFVDYYTQAPRFDLLPPGGYKFLTLLNHRDTLPEALLSNNLDAKPFTLTPMGYSAKQGLWFVASGTTKAVVPFQLTNVYGVNGNWKIEKSAGADWLSLSTSQGEFTTSATPVIEVTANPEGLVSGGYTAELTATLTDFPDYSMKLPVNLYVPPANPPAVTVETPSLTFYTKQSEGVGTQTLRFRNSGQSELWWQLESNQEWLVLGATGGKLMPGAVASITIKVRTGGLPPSSYEGKLTLLTSAKHDATLVPVRMYLQNN